MSEKEKTRHKPEVTDKKGGELYFIGVLIVMMVIMFIEALKQPGLFPYDPGGPGFMPQLMTLAIIVVAVLIGIKLLREKYKEQKITEVVKFLFSVPVVTLIIMIILYAVLLETLHFPLITLIFLISAMIFLDRSQYVKKIIISVGTLVAVIIIFKYIFLIILP